MSGKTPRILVIRNDKLGDFMLAYPSFALLKESLPEAQVLALVPDYTREMADACRWVDTTVVDPGQRAGLPGMLALARNLRELRVDAAIALYSTTRIALALRLARVPYRLAPATKIAQVLYSDRLTQRRSLSEQPEHAYNVDLVRHFLRSVGCSPAALPEPPYLQFGPATISALRTTFCAQHRLDSAKPIVFVHPGSGGSANNLSLSQYQLLARQLAARASAQIVVSAGPNELEQAQRLAAALTETPVAVYHSTAGLRRFAEHIQFADIFISGSTGPLHIAGALDRPTAAFYPRRRSATALRWETLNSPRRRLAFSPPESAQQEDMSAVDIEAAAAAIAERFLAPTTDADQD